MSVTKLPHDHAIFQQASADDALSRLHASLIEWEKTAAADVNALTEINESLDQIARLTRRDKLDQATADLWIGELDAFVRSEHAVVPWELEHIRAGNDLLGVRNFKSTAFTDHISPFAVSIDPEDVARIDGYCAGIDFLASVPTNKEVEEAKHSQTMYGDSFDYMRLPVLQLPPDIVAQASPQILIEYRDGLMVLDGLMAECREKYSWAPDGEQPGFASARLRENYTEAQIGLLRRGFYRQTIARVLNPERYAPRLGKILERARQSANPEATAFLRSNVGAWHGQILVQYGLETPLSKYHPEALSQLSEDLERLQDETVKVCDSLGGNKIFCAYYLYYPEDLANWPEVIEDAWQGIVLPADGDAEVLAAALTGFGERGAAIAEVDNASEAAVSYALRERLAAWPWKNQLESLMQGKADDCFHWVIGIQSALVEQDQKWSHTISGGRVLKDLMSSFAREFSKAWQEKAKQKGWYTDYQRFILEHASEWGEAGLVLLAQQQLQREYLAPATVKSTAEGLALTWEDWQVAWNWGESFSISGTGHNITVTMPLYDSVTGVDAVKATLEASSLWVDIPFPVRDVLILAANGDAADRDAKKEVFVGAGATYNVAATSDTDRMVALNAVVKQCLVGLDSRNYQEKIKSVWSILREARVPDFAQITALSPLGSASFASDLRSWCQTSVDATANQNSPAYRDYILFLSDWVNISRALPPSVRTVPFEPYLKKYPAPTLDEKNYYHAVEVLTLLKPLQGTLYGNYMDGLAQGFERAYLIPLTVSGLARATRILDDLYGHCGNMYSAQNNRSFAKRAGEVTAPPTPPILPYRAIGAVQMGSKDGPNHFDATFGHLQGLTKERLHDVISSAKGFADFQARLKPEERAQAELLFKHYGLVLPANLNAESGWRDDVSDLGDLAHHTDWTSLSSIRGALSTVTSAGSAKLSNAAGEILGTSSAYRQEMFAGQVAPPQPAGTLRGGAPVYNLTLKDGAALGKMYVFDMDSGGFRAEMLGDVSGEKHWSSARVTQERPQMVFETVGVFADNTTKAPAWAMGITREDGQRQVLNSFWSSKTDGVVVISDDFHKFEIRHRSELVGGLDRRTAFDARFTSGEVDNYAQAQLLIYNGSDRYAGQVFISPDNTYQDQKGILGIDARGRCVFIKITEDVTFYEAFVILQQLGIRHAINLDKWGGIHDHTVDPQGRHHSADTGDNGFSRFVISYEPR